MRKKTEANIQNEIIIWCNINRPDIVLIPVVNEAAYNNRNQTILKGTSDLIVVTSKKVVFIEVKYGYNKQTKPQVVFESRVNNLGYEYHIVKSVEEFKKCI
jgi:hypothetical protein